MDLETKESEFTTLIPNEGGPLTLEKGSVLFAIQKFVLTSNIISYASSGKSLGYFKFFPSSSASEEELVRVPSWGYAIVVASRCDNVYVGAKYYGFLPMSTYLVVKPGNFNPFGFSDVSPHRAALPSIYNNYSLCEKANFYRKELDDLTIILRPLYLTGWLLADFLEENSNFGAEVVIVTSASSKTSIGMTHELKKKKLKTIGLTSNSNVAFVESLKLYDRVMTYENIKELDKAVKFTIVDMAGNNGLICDIQQHLKENLTYICAVGNTHWQSEQKQVTGFKVKPKFFFAPTQSVKKVKELGPEKLTAALDADFLTFAETCSKGKWLDLEHAKGEKAIMEAYNTLATGKVKPNEAIICSLWNDKDDALGLSKI